MPLLPLCPKPSPLSFKTTRLYFGFKASAIVGASIGHSP
jgi:hypothetical protein